MRVLRYGLLALAASDPPLGSPYREEGPAHAGCDGPCTAPGYEKYYSVDVPHGFCGETCIHPEAYPLFKVFEKNLTKADGPSPCKEQFDRRSDCSHRTLTPSNEKISLHNIQMGQNGTHMGPKGCQQGPANL